MSKEPRQPTPGIATSAQDGSAANSNAESFSSTRRDDRMVYKSLAGIRYPAIVLSVQGNGNVDLAVDCGNGDWIELRNIPIVHDLTDLPNGTCAHVQKN